MNTNKKEMNKQTTEGLLEMIETDNYEGGQDTNIVHSAS